MLLFITNQVYREDYRRKVYVIYSASDIPFNHGASIGVHRSCPRLPCLSHDQDLTLMALPKCPST